LRDNFILFGDDFILFGNNYNLVKRISFVER